MSSRPVDFLRRPAQPRIGWWLLAIGLGALATALWCEQHWASERAALDDANQMARDQRLVRQKPLAAVEPTLAQRRWQQAEPELRRPWLAALRAVESATVNPIFLLSLTIEPSNGFIKLDGEAPSFDHALAYVQVLDIGGALKPATLVSHEQSPDMAAIGAGADRVKFTAVTRWVEP